MSTTAILHAVGFITGVLSFTVLQFVLARWWWRHGNRVWSVVALITGVALLSVPATSALPFGTVWLYVVVSTAFLVTAGNLARLRVRAASPGAAAAVVVS